MNLLVASSRQWLPQDEWRLSAIRSVIEEALATRINWVLYDRNPDLMNIQGPKTHRVFLRSNSFHHQSLLPFSGVVIAGSPEWQGHELEVLYGLLSKVSIPLLALGLELPHPPKKLSPIEEKCFLQNKSLVVSSTEATQRWFESCSIKSALLPNPLLIPDSHMPLRLTTRKSSLPSVAIVLQRTDFRQGTPLPESSIRNQCQLATRLISWFPTEVVCLTSDDFMRFSAVFPNAVFYSLEAREYTSLFASKQVLLTMDPDIALMGTATGCQPILFQNTPEKASPYYAALKSQDHDSLRSAVESRLSNPRSSDSTRELNQIRRQWVDLLGKKLGPLLEQTHPPLSEELFGAQKSA